MSQRQQLERLLEIDRQIRAGRYPRAESLAEALGVPADTIEADRAYLVDRLGAPIAYDAVRGGWYYTDPDFVLPALFISEGELLAFFLSVEVAQRYLGTAFEAPLQAAVDKLARGLGRPVQASLEHLREQYSFAAPAAPHVNAHLLVDMQRAIEERRPARIRYFTASRGEWTDRVVNPHHLHNVRGDWYLFAWDQPRQAMRSFHLGRVAECQLLGGTFERVPDFSPQSWMKTAFHAERSDEAYDVAIRFDAYQARWIRERRWHATQAPLEELADGGVIVRFRTGGLDEVKRWVLQYGGHAEVLAPPDLRRGVAEAARAMAALYAGDGGWPTAEGF